MLGSLVVRSTPHIARAAAGAHGGSKGKDEKKKVKLPKVKKSKHFPAGVMAGDAEHDRVVLWTKYTGDNKLTVILHRMKEVDGGGGGRRMFVRRVSDLVVKPGGFVHVDVADLEPGTFYDYEFRERSDGKDVGRSPLGHFRTAIAPNALEPVEFGGISCTNQFNRRRKNGTIDRRLRRTNKNLWWAARNHPKLSFFLHAGDQLYCDAKVGKGPATTLAAYRRRYEQAFRRRGLEAAHRAFGMYTTWDDHEVFNDWQGDRDTKKLRPRLKMKAIKSKNIGKVMDAGVQSFFDHQPIRKNRPPAGDPPARKQRPGCDHEPAGKTLASVRSRKDKKIWSSFRWGKTLELFILDGRSERNRGKGRFISKAQEKWLIEAVHGSPAVFKLILNASPITEFYRKKKGKDEDEDKGKKGDGKGKKGDGKGDGRDHLADRWVGEEFSKQRERLLAATNCVGGVCWLSGDLHFGYSGGVHPNPEKYPRTCEILMGPGGSKMKKKGSLDRLKKRAFATATNNYVVLRASPAPQKEDSTLEVWFFSGIEQIYYEKRNYEMDVLVRNPPLKEKSKKKKGVEG